jgi:hypothetical protein
MKAGSRDANPDEGAAVPSSIWFMKAGSRDLIPEVESPLSI